MTDYTEMEASLQAKTMKQLRAIAKEEGICLGYDGGRKDSAVAAIVSWRRHAEAMEEHLRAMEEEAGI